MGKETTSKKKQYIAIDLKSFYASVECVERGLDPLTTRLVVADPTRTEKTICLAVTPALKAFGIPGRARLFEVNQKVSEVNRGRKDPIDFIIAPPRMALYMEYSTHIYQIYMRYIAPEDIVVYSVDEVFMDVTNYLDTYKLTASELAMKMIRDVLADTGITATAGVATNLYLAKVAMDIEAKHMPADENGVRLAVLDEESYKKNLWSHKPLTDFWRVGPGYQKKLHENGMFTMGDVARCSLGGPNDFHNEALLYKLFGVNAELLIDHAWGYEPAEVADIQEYKPQSNSLSSGQVLQHPTPFDTARLIVKEMADLLALDLVDKGLMTDQIVLTVGYDTENVKKNKSTQRGETSDVGNNGIGHLTTKNNGKAEAGSGLQAVADRYGRLIPKHAHGTENLEKYTSSSNQIMNATVALFDRIVDKSLTVRRLNVCANRVLTESEVAKKRSESFEQLSIFDFIQDTASSQTANPFPDSASAQNFEGNLHSSVLRQPAAENAEDKEKKIQQAMLDIKKKFGKNAIIRGMNLEEGATALERNAMIGGHHE